MPSLVSTEISVAGISEVVANSDFTLVVIQASSTLPGTVWLSDDMLHPDCRCVLSQGLANGYGGERERQAGGDEGSMERGMGTHGTLLGVTVRNTMRLHRGTHRNRAPVNEVCVRGSPFSGNYRCERLAERKVRMARKEGERAVARTRRLPSLEWAWSSRRGARGGAPCWQVFCARLLKR